MTSEQLFYDKKTGFDRLTGSDKKNIQSYAGDYKKFLDEAKTERDAVREMVRLAEAKGFRAWTRDDTVKPGDKLYQVNRNKGIDRLLGGVAHIVGVPLAERIRGYVADGRLPLGLERQAPVADRRGDRGLGLSVCLRGGRIGLRQQEEQHGKRNAYARRRADAAKRVAGNGNEHK